MPANILAIMLSMKALYLCTLILLYASLMAGAQLQLGEDESQLESRIQPVIRLQDEDTSPTIVTSTTVEMSTTVDASTVTERPPEQEKPEKSSSSGAMFIILIGAVILILCCLLYYMFFGRKDPVETIEALGHKSIRRAGLKSVRKGPKSPTNQDVQQQAAHKVVPMENVQLSPATTIRSALTDASQLLSPMTGVTTATSSGTATVQSPRSSDRSSSSSPAVKSSKSHVIHTDAKK